jgi:hypothetical protein
VPGQSPSDRSVRHQEAAVITRPGQLREKAAPAGHLPRVNGPWAPPVGLSSGNGPEIRCPVASASPGTGVPSRGPGGVTRLRHACSNQ